MRIAATSDLHGLSTLTEKELQDFYAEEGFKNVDVVVIAGDIGPSYGRNSNGQRKDLKKGFLPWCKSLDAQVVFTLGNHDYLEPEDIREEIEKAGLTDKVHLLINEEITIDGVTFYGNPWTPHFCNWNWNCTEEELVEHLGNMSDQVDVFITHGPPYDYCDRMHEEQHAANNQLANPPLGSSSTRTAMESAGPPWTVCGHIHTGSHKSVTTSIGTQVVNVSLRDEDYKAVYKPFVFEINKEKQ